MACNHWVGDELATGPGVERVAAISDCFRDTGTA